MVACSLGVAGAVGSLCGFARLLIAGTIVTLAFIAAAFVSIARLGGSCAHVRLTVRPV